MQHAPQCRPTLDPDRCLETQVYHDIHQPLVERCRAGDRKAQYEIYKLYAKAMFNVALRITNNRAEAEDALQEAFLNAFQHLPHFKGDSTFGSWLKKIVVNQALAGLRQKKLQWADLGDHDPPDQDTKGHDEGLDLQVEGIRKAIQSLPEGYRVVLSLYLLEGYDHQEIADILHITESTSKSQYSRARQKLAQLIR